jgi:hypothetical protein
MVCARDRLGTTQIFEFVITNQNRYPVTTLCLHRFLYLAVLVGPLSCRVVGWAMANHLRTSWSWPPWIWPIGSGVHQVPSITAIKAADIPR